MDLNLKLDKRDLFGKKAGKLVEDGQILGNVYGKGMESVAVKGDYNTVNKVIREAGKNIPINIEIGSDKHMVLIHDIERDNVTQRVHHVTFHTIKKGEKVHTEVPVILTGDAPAERTGKIVVTILDHVEVEAVPSKIPESFELSVENLEEEHDHLSVSDITVPEGVEILNDPDLLVAKVDIPRAEIEEEEPDEEDVDAADVPSEHGGEEGDGEEGGEGQESGGESAGTEKNETNE